jgi:hypothetical protein
MLQRSKTLQDGHFRKTLVHEIKKSAFYRFRDIPLAGLLKLSKEAFYERL